MSSARLGAEVQWIRSAVERFERPLTLYALKIVGNVESARDVVQETFLRLCAEDRAEVEQKLVEWLYTVCRNRAIDVRRKDSRMSSMSDTHIGVYAGHEPPPERAAENKDAARRILHWLEKLPENQKEVIRLKFQHGLSYQQISAVTKLSVSNVGFLIHTGLKTVRQKMRAAGERT